MSNRKPGAKISATKKNMKVDGRRLFASLAKVTIGGTSASAELVLGGNTGAGLRMAGGAFSDLLASINVEETNESKAWALISLSLVGAIEALRPKRIDKRTERGVKKAFKKLGDETTKLIKEGAKFVVDPEFFEAPQSAAIYQRLRPALIDGLRVYFAREGVDQASLDRDIGARLDTAFNATVYRVMRAKAAQFESLKDSVHAPGYTAALREYEWSVYRTSLRERFELEPVFGQESTRIALQQLYVPPRAAWANAETVERTPRICEPLHVILRNWLYGEDGPRLKLVVGGPGSGKSSFAKAFASEVATASPSVKPLYIPLQRIGVSDNKQMYEQLDEFLMQHGGFSNSPLSINADGSEPFLFLFDGLDEMVVPGGTSMIRVAERFVEWLNSLLGKHRSARALVLGRTIMMTTFQSLVPKLRRSDVYHLMGLAPLPDTMRRANKESDFALIEADQRDEWWLRYALAVNEDPDVPLIYKAIEYEPLTNEPLLCYLLAISKTYKQSIKVLAGNEASLYGALIDSIWERGWGDPLGPLSDGRVGLGARLSKEEFNRLLEAFSYSAWIGGALRVSSQQNFERALGFLKMQELWHRFNNDMSRDLATLALTFYLKGSDEENGFEFTHQTFAEFLLARMLLTTFIDMCVEYEKASADHEALHLRWLTFSGEGSMEPKIIDFLRLIANTLPQAQIQRVVRSGKGLLEAMLRHGLPTHRLFSAEDNIESHAAGPFVSSGVDLENLQRNGQAAFLACYSALLYARVESPEPVAVEWSDQIAPGLLISRLVTSREADGAAAVALAGLAFGRKEDHKDGEFSPLLSSIFLSGADLSNTSFANAQIDLANFSSCVFTLSDFSDAIADRADFTQSTALNARFEAASLRGSIWNGAEVQATDFRRANLEYAILSDSQFNDCDFEFAKLNGVMFNEANLCDSCFRSAKLEDADFTGARIDGVDFSHANLANADFTGVDMTKATFVGANLWGAIVEKDTLPPDFEKVIVLVNPNDSEEDTEELHDD